MEDALGKAGERFKVVIFHNHLFPIPGAGRERNIIHNSVDVIEMLQNFDVHVVLNGHKHTLNVAHEDLNPEISHEAECNDQYDEGYHPRYFETGEELDGRREEAGEEYEELIRDLYTKIFGSFHLDTKEPGTQSEI